MLIVELLHLSLLHVFKEQISKSPWKKTLAICAFLDIFCSFLEDFNDNCTVLVVKYKELLRACRVSELKIQGR